jgi:hypothetical protein
VSTSAAPARRIRKRADRLVELARELARHGSAGRRIEEQLIDPEPERRVGRHAPGRGVRLLEQAELHQLAHRAAHGRWRDRQAAVRARVARADRLAALDVACSTASRTSERRSSPARGCWRFGRVLPKTG